MNIEFELAAIETHRGRFPRKSNLD
jgi:hypothetical protein